jgi:multidrug efflux pump subunit AcrA (membrane-fusion protein)
MPFRYLPVTLSLAVLAACVSPEEQLAADRQKCAGFGFAPGTDTLANCMLTLNQQRDAERAAAQRENARTQAMQQQLQAERDQSQRARDQAAAQQHQAEIMRLMSQPTPSGLGGSVSGMNCSVSTGANAGSLTCR